MRREWEPEDLIEVWTLLEENQDRLRNKSGAKRLGFALLLKFFEVEARCMQEDPWQQVGQRIGQVVTGPVTKIMPFGVFVRIEDREHGFQGLVHTTELDESSEDVVEVGDALTVKIIDVDLARRRIALSHVQALATEGQPRD